MVGALRRKALAGNTRQRPRLLPTRTKQYTTAVVEGALQLEEWAWQRMGQTQLRQRRTQAAEQQTLVQLMATMTATLTRLHERVASNERPLQAERKRAETLPMASCGRQVLRSWCTTVCRASPLSADARHPPTTAQTPHAPATSTTSPLNQAFTKYTRPTLSDNAAGGRSRPLCNGWTGTLSNRTADVAAKVMHECLNDDLWVGGSRVADAACVLARALWSPASRH